jgi:hypothetical protein
MACFIGLRAAHALALASAGSMIMTRRIGQRVLTAVPGEGLLSASAANDIGTSWERELKVTVLQAHVFPEVGKAELE